MNDNFGRWRSDFRGIVAYCLEHDVPGRPVAKILVPDPEDYFVLKPKHSAFYGTALDVLLEALSVRTLILTGVAGNICVLFSANDAYMRDYRVIVPADCVESNSEQENSHALQQMARALKADIRPSTEIDFAALPRSID